MRIALEGLIGVGKSTVLAHLKDVYHVASEPVASWTLLDDFYIDRQRYAAPFEAQVLASYCGPEFERPDMIMERSPDSAFHVFCKMLHRDNQGLSGSHMQMLRTMYEALPLHKADAFVYLTAPIEVCLGRLQWRNRGHEAVRVQGEYLVSLDEAYRHFLANDGRPYEIVALNGAEGPAQVAALVSLACERLKAD